MEKKGKTSFHSLAGTLLIAMPDMEDTRFAHSVVYLCEHDEKGAMGLIINKPLGQISLHDLLRENNLNAPPDAGLFDVYFGGPVESERGSIIHSNDITFENSIHLKDNLAVTATFEVLHAVANNQGPHKKIFVLGYAGWVAGQLEQEVKDNAWLIAPATHELLFETPDEEKWEKALESLGLTPHSLSAGFGHA